MKKQQMGSVPGTPKQKPECNIHVPPDSKLLVDITDKLKLGKTVTLEVTGTVSGLRMDQYDSSLTLTLKSIDCSGSMGGDLDDLREKRKGY